MNDYLPYQVPEVWMLKNNYLNVYTCDHSMAVANLVRTFLWGERSRTPQKCPCLNHPEYSYIYRLVETSRYFPILQLQPIVDRYRQIAYEQSTSQAMRQLRQQFSG